MASPAASEARAWTAIAFLSGIPALVGQVVWSRQVALASGSESEAIGLVVALFFAGLAAGAHVLGPAIERGRRPAGPSYAALEAGIGIVLLAIAGLDLTSLGAEATESLGLGRRLGAAVPILPATILMGGTMPALLRAAANSKEPGRDAGWLLAANTLGSVLGVVGTVAAIPVVGLSLCLTAGGGLSVAVGCLALVLSRSAAAPAKEGPPTAAALRVALGADVTAPMTGVGRIRAAAFVTGFSTLAYEVTIARLAALALGSSLLAWGTVLATTLLALALGNALGGRLSAATTRREGRLILIMLWAAALVAGAPLVLGHHPADLARGLGWGTLLRTLLAVAPAMFALGAGFPILVALGVRNTERAADFGRLNAINTLGGVTGSLTAAFGLLPTLGPEDALRTIAGVALAAGLLLLASTRGAPPRLHTATAFISVLLALLFGNRAPIPDALAERVLAVEHGARATTVVMRTGRSRELIVDGDPEASTYGSARRTEAILAALPFAYHPAPERFLELGLGAGLTLATAGRFAPAELRCVEIAPSVVDVQRFFSPDNLPRPGSRDRAPEIEIADARSFLRGIARGDAKNRYDIIAANTAQPWSVHASGLYAQEHYERMRRALAPGGLVAQWLPYQGVPAESLGEILHTFFSVFEHGGLWWGDGSLFLLGSEHPLASFDHERTAARLRGAGLAPAMLGLEDVASFERRRLAAAETVRGEVATYARLTEDRPRLEGRGPVASPHEALALLDRIARAERARDPRVAAIAEYVASLLLEIEGDARGAEAIQSTLRSAGLALGEQRLLEQGLRQIEEALARGDRERVIALRDGLRARTRDDGRLSLVDALLADAERRREDAALAIRRAMALAPGDPSGFVQIGKRLESAEPENASTAFTHALALDPFSIEALAGDGRIAARAGDFERARACLAMLRDLSPLGTRAEERALAQEIERREGALP